MAEIKTINIFSQPVQALQNDDGTYTLALVATDINGNPVGDSASGQVVEENDLQNAGTSTASLTNAGRGANYTVVVSNLVGSVFVRIEGSLDETNWFNMDDTDTDYEITSNGTFSFTTNDPKVKYFRFTFVSGVADLDIKSTK